MITYVFLSTEGEYQPRAYTIEFTGEYRDGKPVAFKVPKVSLGYDWNPCGMVPDSSVSAGKGASFLKFFYYPLLMIDRMFWHKRS